MSMKTTCAHSSLSLRALKRYNYNFKAPTCQNSGRSSYTCKHSNMKKVIITFHMSIFRWCSA
eukprot:6186262-Pleurochrysis_carterae.AAC.1